MGAQGFDQGAELCTILGSILWLQTHLSFKMADAQAIAVNKINELIKILPKPVSEQLTAAEKASGQSKLVIVSAVLGLALVLLFLLIPAQLMLDLVGVGYPLYA